VLACVILREQVRDLRVQEFLRELVVGFVTLSDLARSILAEILYSVERGDVEQVCSNLEINFPCLRLLISLSLVFISCMLLLLHHYMLDFYFCSIDIYALAVCVAHTFIQPREPH